MKEVKNMKRDCIWKEVNEIARIGLRAREDYIAFRDVLSDEKIDNYLSVWDDCVVKLGKVGKRFPTAEKPVNWMNFFDNLGEEVSKKLKYYSQLNRVTEI